MSSEAAAGTTGAVKAEAGETMASRGRQSTMRWTEAFERELELQRMLQSRRSIASGSAQPNPTRPKQTAPIPPQHPQWGKRPAAGPPWRLAAARQPPPKLHRPEPPHRKPHSAPHPSPVIRHGPSPSRRPPPHISRPLPHTGQALLQMQRTNMRQELRPEMGKQLVLHRPSVQPLVQSSQAANRPLVCGVCNVPCSSEFNLKQHEQGRSHKNKVAAMSRETERLWCGVCNVPLSCELNVAQHNVGKHHLRQLMLRANAAPPTPRQGLA